MKYCEKCDLKIKECQCKIICVTCMADVENEGDYCSLWCMNDGDFTPYTEY